MSLQDDIDAADAALVDALSGPSEVSGDAGSVKQHNLKDLIAVDQYLAAKAASRRRNKGMFLTQLRPPGATGMRTRTDGSAFP